MGREIDWMVICCTIYRDEKKKKFSQKQLCVEIRWFRLKKYKNAFEPDLVRIFYISKYPAFFSMRYRLEKSPIYKKILQI